MIQQYVYSVIREYPDGSRGKREKKFYSFKNSLVVGGLYVHLGKGFPGMQRVVRMITQEIPE